jgi:hypothetical protein
LQATHLRFSCGKSTPVFCARRHPGIVPPLHKRPSAAHHIGQRALGRKRLAAGELMRHFGSARLLALLLGVLAPVPSFAAHWIYIGKTGDTADKIMLDTDSLQKVAQFTLVDILTVYATPRMNSHDITMDRFMQRTAFDCAKHTFVAVKTIGYLQGKRVGDSHETADWKDETVPIPDDSISARIYAAVCKQATQR